MGFLVALFGYVVFVMFLWYWNVVRPELKRREKKDV